MPGSIDELEKIQNDYISGASAPPSSKAMQGLEAINSRVTGEAPPSGGLLRNFGAGLTSMGDWLKGEAGGEASPLWRAQSHAPGTEWADKNIDLPSPSNTTATSLPEKIARGVGAGVAAAPLGGIDATAMGALRGIAQGAVAGAGSAVGQYAGENLAPQGYEDIGGKAGSLIGGVAAPATGALAKGAIDAAMPAATETGRVAQTQRAITDLSGGTPPTVERAPIPNLPLDAAQATNEPNIAAAVDDLNSRDKKGLGAQRTAQNQAVTEAFTGSRGAEPVLAPGISLNQSPEVNAAGASVRYMGALQRANGAIRDEERRLWNAPPLAAVNLDGVQLAGSVKNDVAAMKPSFKRQVDSGVLNGLFDEVADLGPNATLDQLNAIRSDALGQARAWRASGNAVGASAAQQFADSLMSSVQSQIGKDPATVAAYQAARDFTRRKWETLGFTPFQSVLRPNRYGNQAAVPETAAGKLFNFSAGAENVPGGFRNLNDLLDEVKNQWGGAGSLLHDPQRVAAVQSDLRQSLQDYVISKAMTASDSTVTDIMGRRNVNPNALNAWLSNNQPWLSQSGIFSPQQVNLLGRIQQASQMLGRTQNLQGTTNSATYQRLMNGSFLDRVIGRAFSGAVGKSVGTAAGTLLGMKSGMPELGAAVGYGAASLAGRLAAMPADKARALLDNVLRDSNATRDLMSHPSPGAWSKLAPSTQSLITSAIVTGESPPPSGPSTGAVGQEVQHP